MYEVQHGPLKISFKILTIAIWSRQERIRALKETNKPTKRSEAGARHTKPKELLCSFPSEPEPYLHHISLAAGISKLMCLAP